MRRDVGDEVWEMRCGICVCEMSRVEDEVREMFTHEDAGSAALATQQDFPKSPSAAPAKRRPSARRQSPESQSGALAKQQ